MTGGRTSGRLLARPSKTKRTARHFEKRAWKGRWVPKALRYDFSQACLSCGAEPTFQIMGLLKHGALGFGSSHQTPCDTTYDPSAATQLVDSTSLFAPSGAFPKLGCASGCRCKSTQEDGSNTNPEHDLKCFPLSFASRTKMCRRRRSWRLTLRRRSLRNWPEQLEP